jgi:hypothetical protein
MTKARGIEDYMKSYSEWLSAEAPMYCNHAQQVMDMMLHSAEEYNRWFEKNMHFASHETQQMQQKFAKMGKNMQEKAVSKGEH